MNKNQINSLLLAVMSMTFTDESSGSNLNAGKNAIVFLLSFLIEENKKLELKIEELQKTIVEMSNKEMNY